MNSEINKINNELVSCDICMKEVPAGKGKVSEVDDYVVHFCGLECYEKWHKQAEQKKTATD